MESERRRRRPAVSCILCRRRKIRCNRETPCNNCTKSKNATCVYRDDPRPPAQTRRPGTLGNTTHSQSGEASTAPRVSLLTPSTTSTSIELISRHGPSPPTTATPTESAGLAVDCQSPGSHVRLARDQAAQGQGSLPSGPSQANTPVATFTKNSRVETKTLNFAGDFHFHAEHRVASQPEAVTRSVTHKTRHFGQSHWVNAVGLLNDMFDVLERNLRQDQSKTFRIEKQCKALGRAIKSRRKPPWPCPPTPELPAKAVADALVQCYLDTSETILRVLHIPSFMRDYKAVWDSDNSPDPAFLVQLKLVFAIGAVTYDSGFSLRPSVLRWVYEAQTWLSTPEFKSRLGIPSLQTNILLLIAREAAGIGEDMVWASIGSTLRIAIYMGLHRDPAGLGPRTMTPLGAELRRRLWNTILELALQSSLNAGGPPLIGLEEFDTEPPGNFDDDQLIGQEAVAPIPKPHGHFTQSTTAIALRNMFPQRLAIAKYLNNLSSRGTYTETIRLDTELREAYKTLTRTLQACVTPSRGPSDLELRAVDLQLRRYFLALHLPFFAPALQETAFAFSRRVAVESALRFWRAVFPLPLSSSANVAANDGPLARIAFSGSGFFRTVAIQGLVVIAVELKTLLHEEECFGLGPVELRPDLLQVLHDCKIWAWKSIETGETNTKGYLVACMVAAQVEALRKGLSQEDAVASIVTAAEEAEDRCLAILQEIEVSGRQPQEGTPMGAGADAMVEGLDLTPEFGVEDWDYMASDILFNSVGQEPLGWVFQ